MRIRFPDARYKDESDDHLSTGAIDMNTNGNGLAVLKKAAWT
ncbi:hypothetical protein GGI1_00320 [Acidithiobacillus sp. GGI-221]|nr:hypothetical protein GGI1_00320 [Acidithiobacillus sp. GGI-221]